MKAMIVRRYGGPDAIALEEVARPALAANEVLIKVRAVTVNRARDLNVIAGQAGGSDALPLVPGQDPAGEIVEVGRNVAGSRVGERVIVSSRMTCGECAFCKAGTGSDCARSQHIGIHRWGGYAQYVAVPEQQLYRIADQLSFAEAAVAMRHFPMAYQQLRGKVELQAGEWVLVMGASGGLGSACVQVAKLMGAKVIAGAGSKERVAVGMAFGADHGIDYRTEDLTSRVRELTDNRGVEVICENISDPTTFPAAFASLAVMGRLVTAGAHGGGTVPVNMKQLYQSRQRILGSAGHDPLDIVKAMEGAAAGDLKAKVDLVMPLEKLTEAFDLIHGRKVAGKIVIDPNL